jgi:serine/threonine-protein kinase
MSESSQNAAMESAQKRLGCVVDNKYRLVSVIGIGGMGIVYEAEHQFLGRRVALKILHPRYADRIDEFHRFLREARSVGAIGHRAIVEVFDAGFLDGTTPYLVMERLVGENLEECITRKGVLSPKRTFRIAYEVLRGLAAAHGKRIVHCDMKPANVFIVRSPNQRSSVKLLDFGISKLAVDGSVSAIDQPTGFVFGTPFYMSPEQVVGGPIDARTDIYAVGAIVYEALTGRPPFHASSRREVFIRILRAKPDPLTQSPGSLPPAVSALILRMLEKNPDDRPQTAAEISQTLVDNGIVHVQVAPRPPSDPVPPPDGTADED